MNLKELRQSKALTLVSTGVDSGLLSRIEHGKQGLNLRVARQLAKKYKVSIDAVVAAWDKTIGRMS